MMRSVHPSFTFHNCPQGCLSNAKPTRQRHRVAITPTVWNVTVPNLINLILSKFGSSDRASVCGIHSLSSCILAILRLRSKPQMRRINATPIVSPRAVVAYAQSIWYWAKENTPCRPIRQNHSAASTTTANLSVAIGSQCPGPEPARIGDQNSGEESIQECFIEALRSKVFLRNLMHLLVFPRLGYWPSGDFIFNITAPSSSMKIFLVP